MATDGEARIARAAGILDSEADHATLLRTVVEVARGIFGAKASSVMLFDEETDELVFEAVVGEGEETLLGKRIPADAGIAGWVLTSQEPLVIEDVASDPRFARDVAERSGYVPKGLMAAPLIRGETAIGVLSVLDRPAEARFSIAEMDLLSLFATQAALALDLLRRSRRATEALAGAEDSPLARLQTAVDSISNADRKAAADEMLEALAAVLGENPEPPAIRFS
ncbi:MAG: GAF domain-containing protein [Solirubrobacterales bacterium]